MLNSEPSSELDKQQRTAQTTTEQMKMATAEAGSPRRLGLNLNLSVQPHVTSYHWPHSTVADDTSPSRSKGTDDDEDEDDEEDEDRDMDDDEMHCRQDGECSPEDEQDILEMQREERETLNQLARQLASGSRLMAPMLQHLVYQHPSLSVQPSPMHHHQQQQQQPPHQQQSSGVSVSLTPAHRQATAAATDLSPKSSHSGDMPVSGGHRTDVHSPTMSRNNEAQSWTFEEQFRQLYSAGNEADRRSFLDSLFSFMQEQGTPISRLPIMAKRVLDLYTLYKLVIQRGGIVAVITKKLWQEIIRGLGLPPSITSAAFTLRTQYVKYLYAYESRMNQFSTLDELNMAIAGNRREGRRNKSLMYSDMPPPPPGHPHHHHHHHHHLHGHQIGAGGAPPPPPAPPSHHHHHYANVLAADDRFRHLAAAIIDNHHHAAAAAAGVDHPRLRQSCSPPQQQQDCKSSAVQALQLRTSLSPATTVGLPAQPSGPPSSLFNGHQPSAYLQQHQQQQQQHQPSNALQSTCEQTNKQRELLSMLMWMDIVRANQTALPRLPIPSLPSSPSAAAAAAAYTAAAALNLTPGYKGPMAAVPEQSEALNLGKKRTSINNNSGEDDDDGHGNGNGNGIGCDETDVKDDYDDGDDDDGDDGVADDGVADDGVADDDESVPSAAKRIKTERFSGEDEANAVSAAAAGEWSPRPPATDHTTANRRSPRPNPRTSDDDEDDVVEMDINTSTSAGPSGINGLAICVTRRTKNGVYRGQLTKNNTHVNGGLNNNANPFVLHLNGDLYTGHLRLQQQQQQQQQQQTTNN